jgi:uncharacterized NAD-dependent epimerase/dehydratase family protein
MRISLSSLDDVSSVAAAALVRPKARTIDMKLDVVAILGSDVECAKEVAAYMMAEQAGELVLI